MNHRRLAARSLVAWTLALAALAGSAQALEFTIKTNDTGGIIAWSPEIAGRYRLIAAESCARFDKIAKITSVHRRYGDYVGFRCYFARGYDPRKGVFATSRAIRALY